MIAQLLAWMGQLYTTTSPAGIGRGLLAAMQVQGMHRLWLPVVRYRVPFPVERPGKSGVAASRRAARKRRRMRHVHR